MFKHTTLFILFISLFVGCSAQEDSESVGEVTSQSDMLTENQDMMTENMSTDGFRDSVITRTKSQSDYQTKLQTIKTKLQTSFIL